MMPCRFLALLILLLSLTAAPAEAQTQVEMDGQAGQQAAKAEHALHQAYGSLRARLGAAARLALARGETAWLKYRDTDADWNESFVEGGSMAPMVYSMALADATTRRTRQLEALLATLNAHARFIPMYGSVEDALKRSPAYREADKQLNQAYKRSVSHTARRSPLLKSELAWLAYRKLQARFSASLLPKGGHAPAIFDTNLTQMTRERTHDLLSAGPLGNGD